jgi:hypothetical protein
MNGHDSPVLSAQISLFKSQFETLPYQTPTLGQLLTDIRGGLYAELVQELRQIRQTRGAGALGKKKCRRLSAPAKPVRATNQLRKHVARTQILGGLYHDSR